MGYTTVISFATMCNAIIQYVVPQPSSSVWLKTYIHHLPVHIKCTICAPLLYVYILKYYYQVRGNM